MEVLQYSYVKYVLSFCLAASTCTPAYDRAFRDMVDRHGLDASDGTGNVHWVQADLRVPSHAVAGARKVGTAVANTRINNNNYYRYRPRLAIHNCVQIVLGKVGHVLLSYYHIDAAVQIRCASLVWTFHK